MATILTLNDYYLPGFKAGGPIRTIHAMTQRLSGDFRWKIVTRDRDLGDGQPFAGVHTGCWQRVDNAEVFYLPPGKSGSGQLLRLLQEEPYDVLYLNSFFSPRFTLGPLLWRRRRRIPDRPVILAPRGECMPGALRLRWWKKRPWLYISRTLGLYQGIHWHASTALEREHLLAVLRTICPRAVPQVTIAANLVTTHRAALPDERPAKRPGHLRAMFFSRINPKKNLCGALRMLGDLPGQIEFDVIGPIEDREYWAECQSMIQSLPSNVRVRSLGAVPADQVARTLTGYHLLFLPTHGENFCHAIFEALAAGCPVLLSDQTPWRRLEEQGVGWDLPLDRPERFREALACMVQLDQAAFDDMRRSAAQFARRFLQHQQQAAVEENRRLFHFAAASAASIGCAA